MVLKAETQGRSQLDMLKWVAALSFVIIGIIANIYYSEIAWWIRLTAWFFLLAISGWIVSRTQKGKWVIDFFRDSRMELRKVIWPTREETMQTTIVVAVMVVVLALLLWGMDGVLVWLIGLLTGQRS